MATIEVDESELRLILEALEDATVFRDSRSRVIQSAVRRRGRGVADASAGEPDQRRARDYTALAVRLKQSR